MMLNPPLRFSPNVETPEEDEQHVIQGIIDGMMEQSRVVGKREGRMVRASHAKPTALAVGTLDIAAHLPPELAQGVFATPGQYPVAARFAQGAGETLGDRVSIHRGLSLKLFGVEGEKLPGHDTETQDFILASGPTFPSGTAAGFLRDGGVIGKAAALPEGVKSAVSSVARGFNHALGHVGTQSPMADFLGHPYSHPLSEPYYSQAPLRYGDFVAKIAAFPIMPDLEALQSWRLDPHHDEDGFRHETVTYFGGREVVFDIRVQLWNNAETQPIEDASVIWSADEAPFRSVGRLSFPLQNAFSAQRAAFFEDHLVFRPSQGLSAHRPLGSVMRARMQVYKALSTFRHGENGQDEIQPVSIEQIPA